MRPQRSSGAALASASAVVLATGFHTQAQDAKPPEKPPEKKAWETVASLGASLTRGNSDSFLATFGVNTARKWSKDEMLLGANAGFGETTKNNPKDNQPPLGDDDVTTKSDQYVKGFGQWNHLLTERLYVGVRADAIYDEIAGIDYRATLSPLVGYYFIKNPTTFLSGELGPSVIFENVRTDPSTVYFGFRVGERFEHKFSERTKLWQTADLVPQVDNLENWVLNFELGVSAALTKALDLQVKFLDTFDNEPAALRKQNDLKLITALAYKF
jgi:putative salt-induced outer membrane protein YdiY